MAGNVNPIYSKQGNSIANDGANTMPAHIITATADYTGVSANHVLVFTAGANGSFIQRLRFQAEGSNTASVARIYINNGSSHTSAGNNCFYGQISLPTITAINTAATTEVDYPMNFVLNAGHCIWVGLGTTVAAGWMCTAIGGTY